MELERIVELFSKKRVQENLVLSDLRLETQVGWKRGRKQFEVESGNKAFYCEFGRFLSWRSRGKQF